MPANITFNFLKFSSLVLAFPLVVSAARGVYLPISVPGSDYVQVSELSAGSALECVASLATGFSGSNSFWFDEDSQVCYLGDVLVPVVADDGDGNGTFAMVWAPQGSDGNWTFIKLPRPPLFFFYYLRTRKTVDRRIL